MAITAVASSLGTSAFSDAAPVELRAHASQADIAAVIKAVYRQVLGNDHLMQSERLTGAESLLVNRKITVQEFVRQVAKSELYKQKFFHNCFQARTIELNYKHLLGRAPYDESEIITHLDLYQSAGYDADIDSYIDSLEYQSRFGDNIVPYYHSFEVQRGHRTVGFTHIFQLYRGYASSDRAQSNAQKLTRELAQNFASPIYATDSGSLTGTSTGTRGGKTYRIRFTQAASAKSARVRLSTSEVVVPFEQLSSKLQQLNGQRCKVLGVSLS
jgi:phycocyanin-associated rod linker protein